MGENILEMRDITKRFACNTVLDKVQLLVRRGEVHALLGENGAGKSTLMKILMGIYQKDGGTIILDGEEVQIHSPKQALELGIAMIHQELNPVLDLSISENVFLGKEITSHGVVNFKAMDRETVQYLKMVGLNVPPTTLMRSLSVAQCQMVEIAKAISWNAKVIIMDEPTSALTEREVEVLFRLVHELIEKQVSVIFISHKLEEIYRICDRVTVLRNGKYIGTENVQDTERNRLISMMVGRDVNDIYPKVEASVGDVALEVQGLTVPGHVKDASFSVRHGEILGVAGLVGAGRSEMMEAIFGLRSKAAGKIFVNGEQVDIKNPKAAVAHKMAFITEDRKATGLNLIASIRENMTIVSLKKLTRMGMTNPRNETEATDGYIHKLKIKASSREMVVDQLSGGNQQKVTIAKWLMSEPDIIILDEPTRGIDVGAKHDIYLLMNELVAANKAIIMISSEMPEVLGMSDRIMVLADGQVMGILDREHFDQEKLMHMQFGTRQQTLKA